MCGLFGFLNYGNGKIKMLSELTNSLAEESAVRGTDATGIAFCSSGNVSILKESKSAYRLNFKHSDKIKALIGHTRHSTQGSEKKNYNNHPFPGKTQNARFALAHNGVLTNDGELRKSLNLPRTRIETDSYIAVQLIESKRQLNNDSIKFMAEKVNGSFSFSILDDKNNIYLIKGDSPLSILHFPKLKIYVYASTDEILYKALIDSPLFSALKNGEYKEIPINEGEILKICSDGTLVYDTFEYSSYYGRNWWEYNFCGMQYACDDYINDLKSIAAYQGYSADDIDELIQSGFSPDEIEEYIYCMDGEV